MPCRSNESRRGEVLPGCASDYPVLGLSCLGCAAATNGEGAICQRKITSKP